MPRHIPATLAVLAATGLGATSCGLMPSPASHAPSQRVPASREDPGKGGSAGYAAPPARGGTPAAIATAAAAAKPGTSVAALLQAAIEQARRKDWPAATRTFHSVLAIDPRNVYALYDLGVIDETNNKAAQALAHYDQALAVNDRYTPAMYNKAILLEGSRPTEAIALYRRIVAINPQAATAYLRMAFIDAEQGALTQAKAADARAIAIDPSLARYRLPAKK
jgi:tetratricopeptide (TPR) repeat protein